MAILDELTPAYYKVQRMGIQQQEDEVVAVYDVTIYNVNRHPMGSLNPGSILTAEEKQMIAAIFLRDKQQFEAATGLEEWAEPETP